MANGKTKISLSKPQKVCNYILEANGEWNLCRRLGDVRLKTCDKCAFNRKNKDLMQKAIRYYRIVKA